MAEYDADEANALLAELLVRYARVASPDPHKSSIAVAAAHMRDAIAARPLAETTLRGAARWRRALRDFLVDDAYRTALQGLIVIQIVALPCRVASSSSSR